MKNNDNEDIKVIQFNKNNNEWQDKNQKSEAKTDNQNENKDPPIAKKNSKLRAQRTKAPKVYLQNLKKEKKGGFGSLFSCCLPSDKDDDNDD